MAETPNLNPTGKAQLMSNETMRGKHRNMISNPMFQQSLNLALLHYQQLLAQSTTDSNGAAAAMFKLKGAQEFVHQFLYLAEEFKPVGTVKDAGALDYSK